MVELFLKHPRACGVFASQKERKRSIAQLSLHPSKLRNFAKTTGCLIGENHFKQEVFVYWENSMLEISFYFARLGCLTAGLLRSRMVSDLLAKNQFWKSGNFSGHGQKLL